MSGKMIQPIKLVVNVDDVRWERIMIFSKNTPPTSYFIPIFRHDLDILDPAKSIFAEGGFIVKAHLSQEKANGCHFFNIPESHSRLVVDESLKASLKALNLSGLDFGLCPAS